MFDVDQDQSRVTIEVGKAGALSFLAGHTHEVVSPVRGVIRFDAQDPSHSDVRLEIDAAALKVTGKGDPPDDVPKVQQTMSSDQVLDVERHPTIVFQSTSVVIKAQETQGLDLTVSGQLTLRNVTHPLTVPVAARVDAGALTARGSFSLNQTDYGIKPVSVGGVVSVKDKLTVSFAIVAKPSGA